MDDASASKINSLADAVKTSERSLTVLDIVLHILDIFLGESVEVALVELALVHSVKDKGIVDVNGNDLAELIAHNEVGVSLEKLLNRNSAHGCRKDSVLESWVTASYNVSKTSELSFDACFALDLFSESGTVFRAYALGNEDDKVTLTHSLRRLYLLDNSIIVIVELGYYDSSSAGSDAGRDRNITCASAHYLNYVTSRVRFAGVTELIYEVNNGVHRCVKADSAVGRGYIVVNCAGDTYTRYAVCSKLGSALECAVTTYGNDTVDTELTAGSNTLRHTLGSLKLRATVGVKYCTTLVDYIGYISELELSDISLDKSRVSSVYSHYFNAM